MTPPPLPPRPSPDAPSRLPAALHDRAVLAALDLMTWQVDKWVLNRGVSPAAVALAVVEAIDVAPLVAEHGQLRDTLRELELAGLHILHPDGLGTPSLDLARALDRARAVLGVGPGEPAP